MLNCHNSMKTIAALLLSLFCAQAQIAIYKTTGRETIIGGGRTTRLTTHGYLVIDLFYGTGTSIGAFTLNGQKSFVVVPLQNYQFVQATGADGIYDVVAKAQSPSTTQSNVILESVFMEGKNVPVMITPMGSPMGSVNIPRSVTSVGQTIVAPLGVIGAGIATGTGSLDIKGSLAANTAGNGLQTVVNQLTDGLLALGYVQKSPQ